MSYEAKRPGDTDDSGNLAIRRDFEPIYPEGKSEEDEKNKPVHQKPEEGM